MDYAEWAKEIEDLSRTLFGSALSKRRSTMTETTVLPDSPDTRPTPHAPVKIVMLSVTLALLGGFLSGFLASGLHPGSRGATGPAGTTGPAGPAGAAASGEGVCFDSLTQTASDGTVYVGSVSLTSVSKHPDGTTYCSIGTYVAVAPQK